VLKDFSLKIPHGKTVALVGSSGGGVLLMYSCLWLAGF
jgi:ABC-type dipeptide/oligopeptide/nickel transport system ATPase subunit